MINKKESKQVRIDPWLLQPLSRDMKTKSKDQPALIIKNNRKLKNNRKVKAMGNITPTMDHYPRNGQTGDTDPQSDMSC